MLSIQQKNQFIRDGYLVLPSLVLDTELAYLRKVTEQQLAQRVHPYELETHVHYPGAPESESSLGGSTIRRLLNAYDRHQAFQARAKNQVIIEIIKSCLLYTSPSPRDRG